MHAHLEAGEGDEEDEETRHRSITARGAGALVEGVRELDGFPFDRYRRGHMHPAALSPP